MKRMKYGVWMRALVMALVAAAVMSTVTLAAGGPPEGRGGRGAQAAGQGSRAVVTGSLDEDEVAVLTEFLIDEHKALATYRSVMAQFGEVEPFASIAQAEERHIAALVRVFERYGVVLPTIPSFDVPDFASPEAAAAAGVEAEVENAALYAALLSTIDNPDVVRVAEHLRDASLNNHLPAFEAYVDGTYVPGTYVPGTYVPGAYGGPVGRGLRGAGMQGQGARGLGSGECTATDTVQE